MIEFVEYSTFSVTSSPKLISICLLTLIWLFSGWKILVNPQANSQVANNRSHKEIFSKPKSSLNK